MTPAKIQQPAPSSTRGALTDIELANRLNVSRKTLQKWRSLGLGPTYLKLGAKVVYRIEDVEAYVQNALRKSDCMRRSEGGAA